MTLYIYRGDECVDEFTLSDDDFQNIDWSHFRMWLISKEYFISGHKIEFK